MRVEQRELRAHVAVARVGLLPQGHDHPHGQLVAGLELGQEVVGRGASVHRVHARDPHGVQAVEHAAHAGEAFRAGGIGNRVEDREDGAHLAQLPGEHAVAAGELGPVVERAGRVDAGEGERAPGGDRRVEVHEDEQGRRSAHRLLDRRGVDLPNREDAVLEPPAPDPVVGSQALALPAKRGLQLLERSEAA